jgi:hypothetical protein
MIEKYVLFFCLLFSLKIEANPNDIEYREFVISKKIEEYCDKNYFFVDEDGKKLIHEVSRKLHSYDFDMSKFYLFLDIIKTAKKYKKMDKLMIFLNSVNRANFIFEKNKNLFDSDKYIFVVKLFSKTHYDNVESLGNIMQEINFLSTNLIFNAEFQKDLNKYFENNNLLDFVIKRKVLIEKLLKHEICFFKFFKMIHFLSQQDDKYVQNINNYIDFIEKKTDVRSGSESNRQQASDDFFNALLCGNVDYIKANFYLKKILALFPDENLDFYYLFSAYLLSKISDSSFCSILDAALEHMWADWTGPCCLKFVDGIYCFEEEEKNNAIIIMRKSSEICKNISKNVFISFVKHFSSKRNDFVDFLEILKGDVGSSQDFARKFIEFKISKTNQSYSIASTVLTDDSSYVDDQGVMVEDTVVDSILKSKKKEYSELLSLKTSINHDEIRRKRLERFDRKYSRNN